MSAQAGMVGGFYPKLPVSDLLRHLPDCGDGLAAALVDLARDPTVNRCDECIARLQSASHAIQRLRVMLAETEDPLRGPQAAV